MPRTDPDSTRECPAWCAGHEDDQETKPPHWHRSEGVIVTVVERRRAALGGGSAPLFAEDFIVALEQDAQATYLYVGPLEDGRRFFAVTFDSAQRLHAAIAAALAALE